jgi:hypothetical protein
MSTINPMTEPEDESVRRLVGSAEWSHTGRMARALLMLRERLRLIQETDTPLKEMDLLLERTKAVARAEEAERERDQGIIRNENNLAALDQNIAAVGRYRARAEAAEAKLASLGRYYKIVQERLARAQDALDRYGTHEHPCAVRRYQAPCDCGLDEVRRELEEATP